MSVTSTDLVFYGAANQPEADGTTVGGAIDTTCRYVFDSSTLANTLNDSVEVLSSASGDTSQTVTITGRNTAGSIVTDSLSLNGTTVVNGTTVFERILKVVISASHTGTVTVRKATGDTTIVAIESGVLTVRRLGYGISADVSTGSTRNYYEKIFVKNNNGTNALLSAVISENADPSSIVTFDLESSKGGSNTSTNRQTAPSTGMLGSFDNTDKNCPDTDLGAGEYLGIWVKITLTAGLAAAKTTWTPKISGSST